MWRRTSNEEWERKKSYLIRSLFEDIPPLSDIGEESHSAIDSHSESRVRSYSPLPDLIIEQIPNRHDEPKEYYEQLAIRMRKLYKKLFNIKQDTDFDETNDLLGLNIDSYLDEENHSSSEQNTTIKDEEDQTKSNEMDEAGEINNTVSIQGHNDDLDSTPNPNTNKTDSDSNKTVKINQALDHTYDIPSPTDLISKSTTTDSNNYDDENQSNFSEKAEDSGEVESKITESDDLENETIMEEESEITDTENNSPESIEIRKQISYHFNSKTLSTIPEESDQDKDKSTSYVIQASTYVSTKQRHPSKEHDDSPGCKRSSKASILSFEKNEIEVMRSERRRSRDSLIGNPENNSILNKSFIAQNSSFEVGDGDEQSVHSEEFQNEIEQCSSPHITNEHIRRLSEPSCALKNGDSEQATQLRRKRKCDADSGVFAKKKTNESTQTDVESVNWDSLKTNFFVGIPKVFNLCSCKNHKCK